MPRVDDEGPVAWGIRVPSVYQALLDFERQQHERYSRDRREALAPSGESPRAAFNRPRHMLDALEAGQPVTVARWQLGGHSKPAMPDSWRADRSHQWFVVAPDDIVTPTDSPVVDA